MDVRNHMTQSQLLQRNNLQLGVRSPVQKNESVKLEKMNEDNKEYSSGNEKEKLKQASEDMNEFFKAVNTSLRFQFHDKLEEYYVTIVDSDTEEIVKEIPPKKMLDMYASIAERLGFIVDEKI
ncbi:flagellar protein FlaG [Halobacillus aidingensis]|uniref:Flagellar protein FlaG n=1 Tax=Halobacillus aidingensis TaxID=240303 RepID=A0A1H0HJ81_HALAD|nr:flagellar protein FlaG [Halobacillus aidingensis]SDO19160.1 flagellar protein FlaG [Halobacillus aidingensis]